MITIECQSAQQAVHQYCLEKNLRVSKSSKWKINYLDEMPLNQFIMHKKKPLFNKSMYHFSEISFS